MHERLFWVSSKRNKWQDDIYIAQQAIYIYSCLMVKLGRRGLDRKIIDCLWSLRTAVKTSCLMLYASLFVNTYYSLYFPSLYFPFIDLRSPSFTINLVHSSYFTFIRLYYRSLAVLFVFVWLYSPSFTFIQLHSRSFAFINLHFTSFTIFQLHNIHVHSASFTYIQLHSRSFSFVYIYLPSFAFIRLYLRSSRFIHVQ
jgi:hypothetical protein